MQEEIRGGELKKTIKPTRRGAKPALMMPPPPAAPAPAEATAAPTTPVGEGAGAPEAHDDPNMDIGEMLAMKAARTAPVNVAVETLEPGAAPKPGQKDPGQM